MTLQNAIGTEELDCTLYYELTSKKVPGGMLYGAKVTKCENGGKIVEEAQVQHISTDKQTAENFLQLICDNTVTPCVLWEIAEEYAK